MLTTGIQGIQIEERQVEVGDIERKLGTEYKPNISRDNMKLCLSLY